MSRPKVMLPINPNVLRRLIGERETFSERAQKFGVTRQALNSWFNEGAMPPRALIEFGMDIQISKEDLDQLLLKSPQKPGKKVTVVIITEEDT
jgi:hypothetical protein